MRGGAGRSGRSTIAGVAALIQLLGSPGIHRPSGPGRRLRGRKTWSLLAVLALSDRPVSRQALARMLFPDAVDAAAALRWALSELRRGLGPDARISGDPVTLDLASGTSVDAQQILSGLVPADGETGELLAGLELPGCPEFELWLADQRDRVAAVTHAALRAEIGARLVARRPAEAVRLARKLVQAAPLEERHHVLLVSSLAGTGDRNAARAAASACARLFVEQLGVRPSSRVDLAVRAPAAGVTILPDGRRLKARLETEAGKAAAAAGSVADGLERLRLAVAIADDLGDPGIQGEANVALGTTAVHIVALTDREGVAALRRARDLSRVAGDRATAASAWRELAFVAVGARRDARPLLREARELAAGDDGKLAGTLTLEAMMSVDDGRLDEATRQFRRAVDLADRAGEPRKAALSLSMLARAEIAGNDLAAARISVEQAHCLATEQRWTAFLPLVLAQSAELDLHEGRFDTAGEQLACAWTSAVQLGDPCWLAIVGRGLGLLAARHGDPTTAMRWLDSAYYRPDGKPPQVSRWINTATIDTICDVATTHELPRAAANVAELEAVADHTRMPAYAVRTRAYQARLRR